METGWLLSGPLLVADVPVDYAENADEEWVRTSGGESTVQSSREGFAAGCSGGQ